MRNLPVAILVSLLTGCGEHLPSTTAQTPGKLYRPAKLMVSNAAFSPDGKFLATCQSRDGSGAVPDDLDSLTLREVATDRPVWGISAKKHQVGVFAFLPDGKQIVFLDLRVNGGPDLLCLCDAATGKVTRIFDGDATGVGQLAVTPDGTRVLLSMSNGTYMEFFDLKTGKRGPRFGEPYEAGNRVAISPDGKFALSVIRSYKSDRTSNLQLWDAQTGKLVHAFPASEGWGGHALFTPDGKSVLTGGLRGGKLCFVLWDIASRKETGWFEGDAETIALTPDGRGLLGGHTSRKTLRRWDVTTGKEEWSVKVSEAMPHTFAYSPDGKWVFTSAGSAMNLMSEGVELRLWDGDTGKLVRGLTDKPNK